MVILEFKNNLKNADYFKRYVRGARFNRGKNIPNRNIINFNVEKKSNIKVIAELQGSGSSRYIINILQEGNTFKIVHNCPDFKKGTRFCKHIVKILLLLENEVCQQICKNISKMIFTSDFSLVKRTKTKSYIIKAEDLIKQAKYYEAISFLSQAFEESRDFDYILKIGEIALKYKLYDQFLVYSANYKQLVDKNLNEYPNVIGDLVSNLNNYNFSKRVELLINCQKLLLNFPKVLTNDIINQLPIFNIEEPILRYLLLHRFNTIIDISYFFKDFIEDSKKDLKDLFDKRTLELLNEAILNMESEEEVKSFSSIAQNCKFTNYKTVISKVHEYNKKLDDIYKEGLIKKHAFLRSLVIDNTGTDKLRQMKFFTKHNYPTLIWTTTYRNETPLHYYILEKCGFESHHLDYTELNNFIENYPVFKEIFNGTNPVRYGVKNFWGTDKPKINNIAQKDQILELDYKLSFTENKNFILIEWDLAQKPILGSYICQFSEGFLIPDKTHPLTHEIKPFDIILCEKKPATIKGNNVKIMKPLRRVNIKTAIDLVWSGTEYIASYLPLNLINKLKSYKIDELDAIDKIFKIFERSFLPNKKLSKKLFLEFIQNKIIKELNKTYLKILTKSNYKKKVLRMIGFERYCEIFTKRTALQQFKLSNLKRNSLQELKIDLKKLISEKLAEIIKNKNFENVNLKALKKFPKFNKWTAKLIFELKKHLEQCEILQTGRNSYDIESLLNNYYGRILVGSVLNKDKINIKLKSIISEKELSQILENFDFLKLNPPQIRVEKV